MEVNIKAGSYNLSSTLNTDEESQDSSCSANRNHVELAHRFIESMEQSNSKIVVAKTKQEILFNLNHNKHTYELTKRA